MIYQVLASAKAHQSAFFKVNDSTITFGIEAHDQVLPNPAELLLGAFAACCLKNIERFSKILRFDYEEAEIKVTAERQEVPAKLTTVTYVIGIRSLDHNLKLEMLHKNITKYGTIYNTLSQACQVTGEIELL